TVHRMSMTVEKMLIETILGSFLGFGSTPSLPSDNRKASTCRTQKDKSVEISINKKDILTVLADGEKSSFIYIGNIIK
ncbi:MAG: hypothetical protein ACK559_24975, partial [bacterium]